MSKYTEVVISMLQEKSRIFSKTLLAAALCATILMATGCGGKEEAPAPQSSSPGTSKSASMPSHDVTASEHQAFEKKYVEMCVKSQQHSSDTQISNDQDLGKVCECMSQDVSKRLSKAEVVHFLDKKEFPIELVMMTNAAANHCLSQKK